MIDRRQLDHWMARAADGDRACVEPLFQALWPVVHDYTRRFVGDATLAEDCAQDALVQLFSQLERYDRSRDALAWALTLATWQCRTARRKRQRRAECDDAAPAPRIGARELERAGYLIDGHALAEERELARAALETLSTLAPRDIEVIAASITDDDALRAILEPATFRKRLERALSRLRISWRSRHGAL